MTTRFSRRAFVKGGLVAGVAATALAPAAAEAARAPRSPYPAKLLARAGGMTVHQPQAFTFPDEASPCLAVKLGRGVPGGVGPDRDIVAYSLLCTHQGCPTAYDPHDRCFKCPCHFSIFDAELDGQVVCGQAPVKLPRIVLEYDPHDDSVRAVAIEGLLYGRVENLL